MNYTELKQAVKDTVENEFSDSILATLTEQAEQKIYNTVQLASLRRNQTATLSANNPYLSCPSDFLSAYSLAVVTNGTLSSGTYSYLLNKDVNFIREAYPIKNSTGVPKHYAIFGPATEDNNELTFILGPTPDQAYPVELHYYYYPESIVTAGQTWLGDNFDTALLNGVLIEAIRFIKGEAEQVKLYQALYDQALSLLKQLGDGKQRMDAYRDGQVKIPVK
jgi:hypothetical protein